jgi:hypothetical protein
MQLAVSVILTCVLAAGMTAFGRFIDQLNTVALGFRLDSGPQSSLVFDRHDELIFAFSTERRTDRAVEE